MRGCLVKKGKSGVWWAKISLSGEPRWIRLGIMTKHEAERALRAEIVQRERSIHQDLRKVSFKELAEEWLKVQAVDKKPHTMAKYSLLVTSHLIPFFGNVTVRNIRPEHIETFKQEMVTRVSPTTVNMDLRLLQTLLDGGIRWGCLYQNPARMVRKLKQERKQFKALSREEVQRLLESTEGQDRVLFMTAIMTGMRMGEILAMKWENVEWEKGLYTVRESFSSFGLDSPKTESSFRTVYLPPTLLQALREHKVKQNEHRLQLGGAYRDTTLVFATENGNYINPSNLRNRVFYPALKKAGLPQSLRFHDLRGTSATLLLESGANIKFVQDQLGHKTARITLEVYAKVNDASRREAAEKLEAYLLR